MPLEPHEELKLAWELHVMEADVKLKGLQAKKLAQDHALDPQRLVLQTIIATAAVLTPIVAGVVGVVGYLIGRGH